MTKTTMILDNARVDEKTNPVMAISMNKISAKHFNSKPGKHKPTSYGLPVGVKTTLSGLISGRMFTNAGAGILSLLKVDGNVEDAVSVYPFSGIKIPKGWINVVVTNLSETEGASFKVYIKAKAK